MERAVGQLSLFDSRGAPTEFAVRLSARARRLTVRVYPGGGVEVTAPAGTRPRAVEQFVARHRAWIEARVLELSTRPAPATEALPRELELPAVGQRWLIDYRPARRAGFRVVAGERLQVRADPTQPAEARRALRAWLGVEARRALEPWLARLSAEHGLGYRRLQLRRQRTRWGSCSRSGTISLNLCLLFQPPAVVRYLLLHELCHTRHLNHSPRFWSLVESLEPDCRALDRELTRGWRHVPGWVYH